MQHGHRRRGRAHRQPGAPRAPAAGWASAPTRASATAPASTRRRCGGRRRSSSTPRSASGSSRHAMHRCYSEAESRDDLPRAVLLTLAADRERVEALAREAGGELFVAMDNCPHQVVLVGGREAVDRARELADARRADLRRASLRPRRAHAALRAFAEDLRDVLRRARDRRAHATPVYSCTTAAPYPADADAVRELFVEHWTHPVEFRRTIETLYDEGARVFVEAGPRGNMTGFLDDILRGRPYCAVPADLPAPLGHDAAEPSRRHALRRTTSSVDLGLPLRAPRRPAHRVGCGARTDAGAPGRSRRVARDVVADAPPAGRRRVERIRGRRCRRRPRRSSRSPLRRRSSSTAAVRRGVRAGVDERRRPAARRPNRVAAGDATSSSS